MNKKIHTLNIELDDYYATKDVNIQIKKTDISINLFGYYISEYNWNYNQKNSNQDLIDSLVTRDIDWKTINKLYRFPHLSLSRDKLTTLKNKYDVKVVRDMEAADVCVISEKTIMKLTQQNYYGHLFTKTEFIKKLNDPRFVNCFTEESFDFIKCYFDNMDDDEYIYMNDRFQSWELSDTFLKCPLLYFTEGKFKKGSTEAGLSYVSPSNWVHHQTIFGKDANRTFVSDIYVNEVCSEDSIVIDWEYYNNVKKMLSATNDDQNVAMTLMANCQIEKSKTALGLLFFHYGESMKSSKVWNQVAFKAIRQQFDHYMISGWNSGHTSTFSMLVQKLAADDALTEDAMKHVCELVFERVLMSGCGFTKDECAFEMELKDVRLTQEYKDKLKRSPLVINEKITNNSELITGSFDDLPF